MINKSSANRNTVIEYLENVNEDDFINEVVIPLFNNSGYTTLRINDHGPGEHGKDIIFFKRIQAFFDDEYVVVQAKSEKITTDNITEKAYQLIRALRTPIPGISGGKTVYSNYVVFINSKKISNDAHWEFPYLVDGKNNIKILSQENVCKLMLENSIVPIPIKNKLMIQLSGEENSNKDNNFVFNVIFRNKSDEIENLFNYVLPVLKDKLNDQTKEIVVEYIFQLWFQDQSWKGTIKPMKWLNQYLDFMRENQYKYLVDVIAEYISTTHSYEAYSYTCEIVKKLKKEHIYAIKDKLIDRLYYQSWDETKETLINKIILLKGDKTLAEKDIDFINFFDEYKKIKENDKLSDEEKKSKISEIKEKLSKYEN